MEAKKNPKVDLENYRTIFFLIGLVLALIVIYGLFEIKKYNIKIENLAVNEEGNFEQEEILVTRQDLELPPPPPPKQQISDVLEIVSNETKIEDDFNFDVETEEQESIDFMDIPLDEGDNEEDQIFISVEQMPEFPGGINALRRYIAENIQYPVLAQENDIEGTVILKFVVGKDGKVSNVQVLRGVDPLLDSEAIRVVKTLPKFKPGYNNGQPVKVWYTLPVMFILQKN